MIKEAKRRQGSPALCGQPMAVFFAYNELEGRNPHKTKLKGAKKTRLSWHLPVADQMGDSSVTQPLSVTLNQCLLFMDFLLFWRFVKKYPILYLDIAFNFPLSEFYVF